MLNQIKTTLTALLFLIQGITYAQYYAPSVSQDNVQIDFKAIEHLWVDSTNYQFIALSVTGLPEINTVYSAKNQDTVIAADLNSISNHDIFSGGYSSVTLISKKQTFNPVKTIKEVVYDSLSKSNKVKHTSLFLMDDFDKIKKGETLIIYSRGCFGYRTQSYADCNDFVASLRFDKSLLTNHYNCPIAKISWYQEWLKSAPSDYWSHRVSSYFGEKHNYFDSYLERIETVPNKK